MRNRENFHVGCLNGSGIGIGDELVFLQSKTVNCSSGGEKLMGGIRRHRVEKGREKERERGN